MTDNRILRNISRRDFLKIAGGAAFVAAGAGVIPQYLRKTLSPVETVKAADPAPDLYFAGTDGWIYLPPSPPIGFYFPDDLAPAPFNTYIFGFRNITGLGLKQIAYQKMKAQHNAPLFWVDQYDPSVIDPNTGKPKEFRLQLTNLGLAQRPDLVDSHTLHWHGFRNVIPFFDGEPTGSLSVPIGRDFTYVYRPHEPGTYMYHCHVEDVEHVHMGMTGLVFVRPIQNGNTSFYPSGKYAYNDGDGTTGYDREFALFLSEVWAEAHWCDSHIQLPDWTDYHADFSLLNGRVYPDTLAPNGSIDPFNPLRDAFGDLIPPAGHPELQYQPLSSLVTCQPGERVLLRFANLGFREMAMTLAGIPMRVIGRDATLMRGRDGTDTSYQTDTILIGAGESFDVIFEAPAFSGGSGSSGAGYDTYVLYNRRYTQEDNLAGGFGGQRTEIRVYPSGLASQAYPNDWGM
jgi:hypothetical protein